MYTTQWGKSEHSAVVTMVGDEGGLRERLAQAVERFGYQVISDLPLIARRRARERATGSIPS